MTRHSQSRSSKSPAIGRELIQEHRAEIDAVPAKDLLAMNVDVAAAANTAVATMPLIEAHREALVERFGKTATTTLDGLLPSARLLLAANAVYTTVAFPDLEARAQQMRDMRERLVRAVTAFIQRGLVPADALGRLTGGGSYEALSTDMLALVSWYQTNASQIASHSKVTREELSQAYAMAEAFGRDVFARDKTRAGTSEEATDRARAFALYFRHYDGTRRMLTYLRWHEGDVESIAPTIYERARPTPKSAPKLDATSVGHVTSVGNTPAPTHDAPGLPGAHPFHA